MTLRGAVARLLALTRKRRLDAELQGEVLAHLEMAEKDAMAAGHSLEEARLIARRQFGGLEKMREEHRDRRSFRWIENLLGDLRYGLASLARDPAFTGTIIAVLALGIGANVAMFSLVDAVLLKPLPFPEPDRIVRLWEEPRPGITNATSTLDYLDWKRMASHFSVLAAEAPISVALTGSGDPVRLPAKAVTAEYFQVFATNAQIGRTFAQSEDQPGAAPVVVLSHAVWQTYLGADPDILNRRLMLDGQPHQVVGVLPPGAFDRDSAQVWKPLVFTPDLHRRESHWLSIYGRMRQGVTLAQAREQMRGIDASLANSQPFWKRDWKVVVEPLAGLMVGNNLRQSIVIAFSAVVLVLLIACANIANLLLAKGAARRKEMGIRTALGASRARLVTQLLTETMVLCLVGGAAGLALASVLLQAATPFLKELIPYTASVTLDLRVFGFAAAVAFTVGVLAGAMPSFRVSIGNLGTSLRDGSRGSSGANDRIRRFIVIAEVGLSLVLVCGALLLFRSLGKLQQVGTGVTIEGVITMSLNLPAQAYPSETKAAAFYDALRENVQAVPGVSNVALSTHLPLRWIGNGEVVEVPGQEQRVNVRFKRIDAGYLETFGIPVLAGRGLTERDRSGAQRVAIINESLAARLADVAGLRNPIGRTVRVDCPAYLGVKSTAENVEIVGIIRNERVASAGAPTPPVLYAPLAQLPQAEIKLVVNTRGDSGSVVSGIRTALRQIDPNLPLGEIATMEEVHDRTLSGASRPAWLIGAFAAMAALLAATGLYGVLSQSVTQRRREMGIRMALGARPGKVLRYVLRDALTLVIIGLVLGGFGTIALTRVIRSVLFQVSPWDPIALSAACASMILIGLMAAFVPANRASRVDPAVTLREEG